MSDLALPAVQRRLRPLAVVLLVISASMAVPVGVLAIALGLGLFRLPYELFLVLRRLPIAFPMHMLASGIALILIPIAAFARHWTGLHRIVGRMAAAAVALGGLTALPVALASEAPVVARVGFFAQGVTWLALLAAAVVAIRRGRRTQHASFMLAVAAVASGAIWLRLVMAAAIAAELPFTPVYAAAAWACWLLPLAVAAASSVPTLTSQRLAKSGRLMFGADQRGGSRVYFGWTKHPDSPGSDVQ